MKSVEDILFISGENDGSEGVREFEGCAGNIVACEAERSPNVKISALGCLG